MSPRRSSRSSVKQQRRTRAAARKKAVVSRAKRIRKRPANVETLVYRFGKVQGSRNNKSKGAMSMSNLIDTLPTSNPFRKKLIVKSKSRSRSKSKSKSKSKSRSPVRRRSNKTTGDRRYSHIMNRRYSRANKKLSPVILNPPTFQFQ